MNDRDRGLILYQDDKGIYLSILLIVLNVIEAQDRRKNNYIIYVYRKYNYIINVYRQGNPVIKVKHPEATIKRPLAQY